MAQTKGPASVSCSQPAPPSASALIICRNKHWRYISSFHGPWLQLPPEILESLAHSNYQAPRPRPIHPAVFYDLVNIRKAVDEATNLAVRATSGLTSAALSSQANAANGILGSAAQLGLGYVGAGHNTKLSRERKYRMRELATQKLSHAYHLDEIAASVATMQSASTLEDVALLVLQRSAADADAKYVHFFHEKIPSRMMAEYTPLDPLNDIISERPSDGSPLRTRALTRLFKEDYIGAARDLTDGLAVARYAQQQHRAGNDQLVLAKTARGEAEARRANPRQWRDPPVKEEDQPSSLETQLLFHRAGVYFTMACQHVHAALEGTKEFEARRKAQKETLGPGAELPPLSPGEKEAHRIRLENRKLVKTYAKRALRDYVAFLSHFDYTPGLDPAIAEAFLHKVNDAANGVRSSKSSYRERMQELTDSPSKANGYSPDALVPHQKENSPKANTHVNWSLPPPDIYQLSALFSSTPPANLPPYPSSPHMRPASKNPAINAFAESQEAVTYHPLLTDALHSLLLCHALVQTPPTELRRHAHNVARVARICDGYPIFLAARSPARADWIEVLRRASNWIELAQSWEQLCRPAPLPGTSSSGSSSSSSGGSTSSAELLQTATNATTSASGPCDADEAEAQRRERKKHEAIVDALADERVVDEESFQRALRARDRHNRWDEEQNAVAAATAATAVDGLQTDGQQPQMQKMSPQQPAPKRWTQEDGKEYPVSTERAEAIARWVREAPLSVREGGKKRKGKKGARRKEGAKTESKEELEGSVEGERVSERVSEKIDE